MKLSTGLAIAGTTGIGLLAGGTYVGYAATDAMRDHPLRDQGAAGLAVGGFGGAILTGSMGVGLVESMYNFNRTIHKPGVAFLGVTAALVGVGLGAMGEASTY